MARIVKEQAYAVRRNAILDVAQRLVETKGNAGNSRNGSPTISRLDTNAREYYRGA